MVTKNLLFSPTSENTRRFSEVDKNARLHKNNIT
jgi:hypothetical protein